MSEYRRFRVQARVRAVHPFGGVGPIELVKGVCWGNSPQEVENRLTDAILANRKVQDVDMAIWEAKR